MQFPISKRAAVAKNASDHQQRKGSCRRLVVLCLVALFEVVRESGREIRKGVFFRSPSITLFPEKLMRGSKSSGLRSILNYERTFKGYMVVTSIENWYIITNFKTCKEKKECCIGFVNATNNRV